VGHRTRRQQSLPSRLYRQHGDDSVRALVRPPGSERLVFLSNYDGSWESYLEDFITKAYLGQNAAWSNAVGFPRTKWLTEDGAQDGDRFKRWVRRQQLPTQFWFHHFSHLTADQIRNNAVISWELARATTDSQARAWLSYFGSMPKTDTVIETQEVQSVVFRGFKRLPFMKFAAIRLPDDREICASGWRRWWSSPIRTHAVTWKLSSARLRSRSATGR
jgi:hypothetical protein